MRGQGCVPWYMLLSIPGAPLSPAFAWKILIQVSALGREASSSLPGFSHHPLGLVPFLNTYKHLLPISVILLPYSTVHCIGHFLLPEHSNTPLSLVLSFPGRAFSLYILSC